MNFLCNKKALPGRRTMYRGRPFHSSTLAPGVYKSLRSEGFRELKGTCCISGLCFTVLWNISIILESFKDFLIFLLLYCVYNTRKGRENYDTTAAY